MIVDTIEPVLLNEEDFWEQGDDRYNRYVYFSFNVSEVNFDEINYIDWEAGDRAKWRRLCSRLKDGVCEKKKSFRRGNHSLSIEILDDAGNRKVVEGIEFEVV